MSTTSDTESGAADTPVKRSSRAWLANSALLVASVIVSLLLLEGALRVHQWLAYGTTAQFVGGQLRFDPDMKILAPVPGFKTKTLSINSLGFRGPEVAEPKPPGTVRIAFLGGSTTYCSEVSADEAAWPHLVSRRLDETFDDVRFDYINAAVPGYTTRFSLKSLRARVERHAPDVIVVYHATNDLASLSRRQATEQGVFRSAENGWLDRHSLLWTRVKRILELRAVKARGESDVGRLAYDREAASRQFTRDLTALLARARELGAVAAVATFSHRVGPASASTPRVHYSPDVAMQNMPYMRLEDLMKGYRDFNDVIRDVAPRAGAILIGDEDAVEPTDENYSDSFHFTDAGSRQMAGRIADALLADERFLALVQAVRDR